jgi:hypothetical protein
MAEIARVTANREGQDEVSAELTTDVVKVGRDDSCDLILPDKEERRLSRLHCTLERVGGAWWLFDNESRNHVYVNGELVNKRTRLFEGDVIDLGKSGWKLCFHDPLSTLPLSDLEAEADRPPTLEYDPESMRLLVGGREIGRPLPPQEHKLLRCLYLGASKACSKKHLEKELWEGGVVDETGLAGLVRRLRERIEPDPAHPMFIVTIPGFGYRLDKSPPGKRP